MTNEAALLIAQRLNEIDHTLVIIYLAIVVNAICTLFGKIK